MESSKVNIGEITQIPESEFKEHFREWMEQDHVARCLQAKLRRDLIFNFNKTTLGKKLLAQTAASHRLNLSPLSLALNTLVAEFLYAQNCHFTLSVFCTEVPYRNTLPDFEGVRYFRFSDPELLEIFDALSSKWLFDVKDDVSRQYAKEKSSSLLFVVLKCLLQRPLEKSQPPSPKIKTEKKTKSSDVHHMRHLNKFLVVFLKKVQEMSKNLSDLQAQKTGPRTDRKTMNMRKLDSLHRSMHKISENLRQMSLTKRKSRSVTTIVSAINSMAKQFERCALGFHQAGKQMSVNKKESEAASVEKTYNDWINEMRTTANGKKFLEKVEHSLHKALLRERDRLEGEFQRRLQIQKDVTKAKYRQKFVEELAKFTAREKADTTQELTETLEKKLKEFEVKTKEISEQSAKVRPQADLNDMRPVACHKDTQTSLPRKAKPLQPKVEKPPCQSDAHNDRRVDCIVLDAKQRVLQLEQETNQLERNIREFLEKQKCEKKVKTETASHILNKYAMERSILEKKCAAFRTPIAPINNAVIPNTVPIIDDILPRHSNPDRTISSDFDEPIVPPTFQRAFRAAHKQILAKNKTSTTFRQHFSSVLGLIDNNKDEEDTSPHSPPCRAATKVTLGHKTTSGDTKGTQLPSPETGDTDNGAPRATAEHMAGRQVLERRDNGIPSEGNAQQMNSNHSEEAESSAKQINNDNGDGDAKKLSGDDKSSEGVNQTFALDVSLQRDGSKGTTSTANGSVKSPTELGTGASLSSSSFRFFDANTMELKLPKESSL